MKLLLEKIMKKSQPGKGLQVAGEERLFISQEIPLPFKQAEIVEILMTLKKDEEITGYEIVKRSEGAIPLGGIYAHLDRLEEKGIIESRVEVIPQGEASRVPRRMIRLKPGLTIKRSINYEHSKRQPKKACREVQPAV